VYEVAVCVWSGGLFVEGRKVGGKLEESWRKVGGKLEEGLRKVSIDVEVIRR
jgi:hypothetical protein